jgi:hypothetical protein
MILGSTTIPRTGTMVPIVVLTAAALMFGYVRRYPIGRLAVLGMAGLVAGIVVFGIEAAVADQPKVPCWSQMHGAEFFRAMPFACQAIEAR